MGLSVQGFDKYLPSNSQGFLKIIYNIGESGVLWDVGNREKLKFRHVLTCLKAGPVREFLGPGKI